MPHLTREEVIQNPASLVDNVGFVFHHEGRVHRAITPSNVELFNQLLGERAALEAAGLCPAQLSDLTVEGAGLVVEHETVRFVTYPADWPSAMLAEATIFICELQLQLMELGLSLKDGHPWNILWRGMKPTFVDWGSLVTGPPTEQFLNEVKNWLLFPLYLKAAGMHDAARSFLLDVSRPPLTTPEGQFFAANLKLDTGGKRKKSVWSRAQESMEKTFNEWVTHSLFGNSVAEHLKRICKTLPSIASSARQTEWATYEGADLSHDHSDPGTWNLKTRNVNSWMERLKPTLVLDIGCNRGWYSQLARQNGALVLSVDVDETSLNTLCNLEKSSSDLNIALLDLANPTPAHGVGGAYAGALERYSADLVLLLAVTHHLYFKRSMSFRAMAESLAQVTATGGTLIVEFVPADDVHVAKWIQPCHKDYTLDNFVAEFSKQFTKVTVEPACPEPRVLCICHK